MSYWHPTQLSFWHDKADAPSFICNETVFSSCESNVYKKCKSIKCLQVIFKLRLSNQMVLILPIFAQITVWFQYKQKRFLHAFMNVLEMETYPKKKKNVKSLNSCCLCSKYNIISRARTYTENIRTGKSCLKLTALPRFTPSLTDTAHLSLFTSSCIGFHLPVVCPLVNMNTAVQKLLIHLFWVSLGRKENTNYWRSSSAGMPWNFPVSQRSDMMHTRSYRDNLVHHLYKNMWKEKDAIHLSMEKFDYNNSQ